MMQLESQTKLPALIPPKGKIILAFRRMQETQRNMLHLAAGIDIEVVDWFNPNQYSIEEAEVYETSAYQKDIRAGDNVIIDFTVFTAGLYKDKYKTASGTRQLYSDENIMLYWAHDDQDKINETEIFAITFATPNGKQIFPRPGFVFIEPEPIQDHVDDFENKNGLWRPKQTRDNSNFFATVFASSEPEIETGDSILCQAGMSAPLKIKWNNGETHGTNFQSAPIEYIKTPFILGKKDSNEQLKLF